MSQFQIALIASVSILAVILATDLGRRRATTWRVARSLIAVVVVAAIFVHSFPTAGNDVSLQLAGIGAGVICGLAAAMLLPVYRGPSGEIYTRAGIAYAALWVVLSAARVVFAYGSEHWFPAGIVKFSIDYRLTGEDVYANAFVFMALAMVLTRSAVLLTRRYRLRARDAGAELPAHAAAR